MRIRKQQMDAMSASLEQASVQRMVHHLRDDVPKQRAAHGIKEKDIEPLVRRGMAEAQKYGLVSADHIRVYLDCVVVFGPSFDRDKRFPWAGEILRRRDQSAEDKAEELSWHLLFDVEWEEAPQ